MIGVCGECGGDETLRGGHAGAGREKAYRRWRGGSENDYQMSGGEAERGSGAARKWGWCGLASGMARRGGEAMGGAAARGGDGGS